MQRTKPHNYRGGKRHPSVASRIKAALWCFCLPNWCRWLKTSNCSGSHCTQSNFSCLPSVRKLKAKHSKLRGFLLCLTVPSFISVCFCCMNQLWPRWLKVQYKISQCAFCTFPVNHCSVAVMQEAFEQLNRFFLADDWTGIDLKKRTEI